jgi:hypothetical protein
MADSALATGETLSPKIVYQTLTVNNDRSIADTIVGLKYDRYLEGRKLRNHYKTFEHFSGNWEWTILSDWATDTLWAKREGFEQSSLEHLLALSEQFPDLQKKNQIRSRFLQIDYATKAVVLLPDRLDFVSIIHAGGNLKVLYVRRFSEPLPFTTT